MRHFRKWGIFWIVAFVWLGAMGLLAIVYQAWPDVSTWRREGLKTQLDQLQADHDQLRADYDGLVVRVATVRSAGAFCMAYQVERHTTLRDANFPVGYELSDVAGVWHPLTQADLDNLAAKTALAEQHYTALTTP